MKRIKFIVAIFCAALITGCGGSAYSVESVPAPTPSPGSSPVSTPTPAPAPAPSPGSSPAPTPSPNWTCPALASNVLGRFNKNMTIADVSAVLGCATVSKLIGAPGSNSAAWSNIGESTASLACVFNEPELTGTLINCAQSFGGNFEMRFY